MKKKLYTFISHDPIFVIISLESVDDVTAWCALRYMVTDISKFRLDRVSESVSVQ